MQVRMIYILVCFSLPIVFLSIIFINSTSSQSQGKMNHQIYVKKGDTWYVQENGKLYQVYTDVIAVKFKAEIRKEEIELYTNDHSLRIRHLDRLGVYDLEVVDDQEIFKILYKLNQSELVEFAEFKTIGEWIVDDTPVTEIIFQDKRLVRKDKKWYLESNGHLYEVILNSLSCNFKKETTQEQLQEFLSTYQLKVIRKNRLNIYDFDRNLIRFLTP